MELYVVSYSRWESYEDHYEIVIGIYSSKEKAIEQAAIEADPDIYKWILKAVTEGYSYEYLRGVLGIPCSRDYYYDKYRKFFWCLSRKNHFLL